MPSGHSNHEDLNECESLCGHCYVLSTHTAIPNGFGRGGGEGGDHLSAAAEVMDRGDDDVFFAWSTYHVVDRTIMPIVAPSWKPLLPPSLSSAHGAATTQRASPE